METNDSDHVWLVIDQKLGRDEMPMSVSVRLNGQAEIKVGEDHPYWTRLDLEQMNHLIMMLTIARDAMVPMDAEVC